MRGYSDCVVTASAGQPGEWVENMLDDDREWLEAGVGRPAVHRPEIVDSWRRSLLSGVDPEGVTIVSGEASLESKVARAGIPVLSAMADVMIGANTALLLTAPDGTILWRWAEDSRLTALLDRSYAVVGTRFSEDVVGTNGIGTSLETIQPIVVSGGEHFSEVLHPFTCAGAPILHPITRRVTGTLSVTSLVKHSNTLMAATLKKLTREIAEQLYGESTLRERELLHHFLSERRRGRAAVVAVNQDTVIANTAGARLPIDHRSLWNEVEAEGGGKAHIEIESPDFVGNLSCRTIMRAGSVAGLVIVADPARTERSTDRRAIHRQKPERDRTPQWADLSARLRDVMTGCDRILVTGEAGVGKRTILREVLGTQDRPLRELDCAAVGEAGAERWLVTARAMLTNAVAEGGDPLMVSHLESLTIGQSRALGRILDQLARDSAVPRIAGTWTPTGTKPGPVLQALLDRFHPEPFEVPPLRKRPRDVLRALVHQGAALPVLSPEAAEQVQRHPWPGNYRQLEEFRRWLGRQARPIVGTDDLPPRWSREAARARFTAIQAAEADAIEGALRKTDGNKVAAAAALGIARSSLYRKMREYRLT
jgi:sigma-54 dependent transcriptional regulator, acetoin dehydrogenase operon transcriptional activator AcoR